MRVNAVLKKIAVATALFGAVAAVVPAQASVQVSLWQSSALGNGLEERAEPSNPLAFFAPITTFDYAGSINWRVDGDNSTNKLNSFVGYSGGTVSNCVGILCSGANALSASILSTGNFATTTLFRLIFTTVAPVSGMVLHDDGLSIYNSANVAMYNSPNPTSEIGGFVNLATPGTYTAWYVEANGSPSVLSIADPLIGVPEPSTVMMIAMALLSMLGFGVVRRRALN